MKRAVKMLLIATISVVFVLSFIGCATVSSESATDSAPIGIISAMSSELELLLENAEIDHTDVIGNTEYHVGKLAGKDVVLVQAGIGKILASAGAATLINEYNVSSIIFTGIAGGVGDNTKVMDIVVSDDLVVHDYGDITNEGFVWDVNHGTDNGYIHADSTLADLAYETALDVVGEGNVWRGTIATGDQFVASEWYVKELQEKFDATACEMEGAAVALVASQYNVPFVVIRCMSDKADGLAHGTYQNFMQTASDNSAKIVISMVESL